jgi:hypothetical protein
MYQRTAAGPPMTLANLIDLEAQLARDRDADPAALAGRDRTLLPDARVGSGGRGELLARWLDTLRERDRAALRPGRAVAGTLRGLRTALAAAGLVLGWGAGTAVTSYGGGHPVNVWNFLLVLVGVQALLLVLLAASFFLPLAALGAPALGLLRSAIAALYPRLAARALRDGAARAEEWRTLWHRVRTRRSLYHAVEPWVLLSVTQAFGVAFNVGALAAVLRLVVFTDVAFGWSTTLVELDGPRFHALVRAVAWPWRAVWPDAVPTEALVEATRYSRLEGAYAIAGAGRSARPELVGGWWPFLAAALLVYGLLPRVALLALAHARAARILARLPHADAEVARVVARLTAPHVDARAPRAEAAADLPAHRAGPGPLAAGTAPCAVVLWRDVPGGAPLEAAVSRALGRPVAWTRRAGGRDHEEAGADWAALADGADLVVVAEGFEPPDRALRRLLVTLRGAVGAGRPLTVLLLDAAGSRPTSPRAEDVRVWRDGLAPLEDPYLAVEPLREAP